MTALARTSHCPAALLSPLRAPPSILWQRRSRALRHNISAGPGFDTNGRVVVRRYRAHESSTRACVSAHAVTALIRLPYLMGQGKTGLAVRHAVVTLACASFVSHHLPTAATGNDATTLVQCRVPETARNVERCGDIYTPVHSPA